jgi:hypothetical protein
MVKSFFDCFCSFLVFILSISFLSCIYDIYGRCKSALQCYRNQVTLSEYEILFQMVMKLRNTARGYWNDLTVQEAVVPVFPLQWSMCCTRLRRSCTCWSYRVERWGRKQNEVCGFDFDCCCFCFGSGRRQQREWSAKEFPTFWPVVNFNVSFAYNVGPEIAQWVQRIR